jgi:hypothetical protein
MSVLGVKPSLAWLRHRKELTNPSVSSQLLKHNSCKVHTSRNTGAAAEVDPDGPPVLRMPSPHGQPQALHLVVQIAGASLSSQKRCRNRLLWQARSGGRDHCLLPRPIVDAHYQKRRLDLGELKHSARAPSWKHGASRRAHALDCICSAELHTYGSNE